MATPRLKIKAELRRMIKTEKASFTLESAFIFPAVFIVIGCLLFYGLHTYLQAELFAKTSAVSVMSASVWDQSEAELASGRRVLASGDGLYWQMEQTMRMLFGASTSEERAKAIREGKELSFVRVNSEVLKSKLSRSVTALPESYRAEVQFEQQWLGGKVRFDVFQPYVLPSYATQRMPDHIHIEASAWTSSPVEWVRSTQWVRTFIQDLKSAGISEERAHLAIQEYMELSPRYHFRYQSQAASYLRTLVNGEQTSMILAEGNKRIIDALDSSGVAHQAYVTFRLDNLREQMEKDIELLVTGRITGAVWHFFKREGEDGPTGPPASFIQELEQNQIVVVLHE